MANQDKPFTGLAGLLGEMRFPGSPGKWKKRYVSEIVARGNRRVEVLRDRIRGITG